MNQYAHNQSSWQCQLRHILQNGLGSKQSHLSLSLLHYKYRLTRGVIGGNIH